MYVSVRNINGESITITISKFTSVQELKEIIEKEFHVSINKQRLFFSGKQLEDEHIVCDYNVNVNDVIQLMIRPDINEDNGKIEHEDNCKESSVLEPHNDKVVIPCESLYFKIGDVVDAKDICYGAWFEGKIIGIYKTQNDIDQDQHEFDSKSFIDDGLIYKVLLNRYPYSNPINVGLNELRPRARYVTENAKKGDIIMVNYNMERPTERGLWYDLMVTSVTLNKTGKPSVIKGNLYFGSENNVLNDCKIKFVNDLFKIEQRILVCERSEEDLILMQKETDEPRTSAPFCDWCKDKTSKCTYCNCHVCGIKAEPEKQVLCDECNMAYHIWCLTPPLDKVPEVDEWYCHKCKNDENEIIKAGDKLKKRKINSRAKLNKIGNKGRGMACVGRAKDFTLVPFNHIGAIPGIEVGTTWKFRMQVAEAGVHRPHVAGIHGRENHGAYSIVLSGGYEDDIDNGDEIIYTGSGGRDLTGRRTAGQSCDQTLTRLNKALALNCKAPLDPINGAEAEDWRQGNPVRVVRNFRGAKHSKYAPKEGNRYDGLYKVVKYYPEKGKSGFLVWRYLLRRDDPSPAPWTEEGKIRIASLGLEMIYPDGYLQAMENINDEYLPKKKRRINGIIPYHAKRQKVIVAYDLEKDVDNEIEKDKKNAKLWKDIKSSLQLGKKAFLSKVEEEFTCICCHELIFQPVTLPCFHNLCISCLQRSFQAKIYVCPYCRKKLGKNYDIIENEPLQKVLLHLFPGYSAGR
ncbi:hypothetical protein O3M35_010353 [Rhynocoris fuscipes]|uniref:RING-type E3 ubiquitin transferase n=1 Tax=Rhynocoris fuscipes TaxID=488301 RepID=A0AAW1CZW6_9HEMI